MSEGKRKAGVFMKAVESLMALAVEIRSENSPYAPSVAKRLELMADEIISSVENPRRLTIEQSPIGVIPQGVWRDGVERERITDLMGAIVRFKNAGKPVPMAWITELGELTTQEQPEFWDVPRTAPDAPTAYAYERACAALEDWKKLARRWLTALLAIRDDRAWHTADGSSVVGDAVIARYAICDCWKHGQTVCDFCQGVWGEYLATGEKIEDVKPLSKT